MDQDTKLTGLMEKYRGKPSGLIPLILEINTEYGYLPKEVLYIVSHEFNVTLEQIYGIATFYQALSLIPRGKHHVCVCMGTACHVRGADKILEKFEQTLAIKSGHTTEDREYTLESVNCLGACALAPLVTIDGKYYTKTTTSKVNKLLNLK